MSSTVAARVSVWPWCILAVTVALTSGCGRGERPAYGSIKGKVTVGEEPMRRGRILFLPVNPGGPTVSAAIRDGEYAIPLSEGLIAGESRIEVEGSLDLGFELDDEEAFARRGGRPLPPNPIPAEFNRKSILRAPVKPGENTLNIAIPELTT